MTTKIKSGVIAAGAIDANALSDNSITIAHLNCSDGTNGQVLSTDGSGTLSFTDMTGGVDGIVSSADATAITIDSSENVGIGTSSPASLLDVRGGNIYVDGGGSGGASQVILTTSASSGSNFGQISNTGTRWSLGYGAAIGTVGTEALTWNSSGNVGIGTTSPAAKLHVEGATSGVNLLIDDSTGWGVYVSTQNTLNFNYGKNSAVTGYINFAGYQNGYTQFRNLDISNGKQGSIAFFDGVNSRVGIGTTSPAVSLDVSSKTDAIRVPNGTDAQQPTGTTGMMRYNTTNSKLEAYIGSDWANIKTDPQDLTQINGLQVWADVTGGITSTTVADLSGNNRTGTLASTSAKGTLSGNTYFEAMGSNYIEYPISGLPNSPWSGSNACTYFFVCTNKKTNNTYASYITQVQNAVSYQIIRHNGASTNYNVYAENLSNWQITATNAVPVNATISEAYILIFQFKAPSGNSQVEIFKRENGSTTSATHAIAGNTYSFEWTDNGSITRVGTSAWSNEYLNAGIFAWGFTNTEMSSADRQIIYDYYADKGLAN